jgi:hypothetical protein
MSLYDELKSANIVRLLSGMIHSGNIDLRGSDGKFVANLRFDIDTPWIHAKSSYRMKCFLWKDVTFHEIVEKKLPKDKWFVPMGCQDCFKVVVRPGTLQQLFALESLQTRLDHPSKCGIEIRPSVFGNYGGYFYNRGLKEGLECYLKVRNEVDADEHLGPNIPVILKRGCTEMEHGVGRSDQWTTTKEQIDFEVRLAQLFVDDTPILVQSEHAKNDVRQRWIERAFSIGDVTVFNYTDWKPLYPEYVTYQHLINQLPGGTDLSAKSEVNDEYKDSGKV